MNKIIRAAVIATVCGATALGFAGTATASPADVQHLCDTVDANGMCQMQASGPFNDIDVSFPAHTPQQDAIASYVQGVIDQYTSDTDGLDPTAPMELDVTGTTYNSGPITSVIVDVYRNTNAAYPLDWYKAFNYNNATKTPLTFDGLFRPGTDPLKTILPIVRDDLARQAGESADIPDDTGLDPANYQDFRLTDDAVIFYFSKDTLRPAMGSVQVSVPRSAIAGLLTPGL